MSSVKTLVLGILVATAAPGLSAQAKSAVAVARPASASAAAAFQQKPAAKPPAKSPAKTVARRAPRPAAAADPSQSSAAPESDAKSSRRDPFESLTARQEAAAKSSQLLPPGKAGLQISTLRVDGIVRSPNGMIAVVTNPQARTYFLREGDQLFDGRVEKIAMDGVSFHEVGKDAFGKPLERQVNKRIYSSAGEQQ